MEALFETCRQLIAEITRSCLASEVYAEECLKMAKLVAKCALVLSEIELFMHAEQSLRGSNSLFRGIDNTVSALKLVRALMEQCASARGGGVWPLEDAVEFEAVALELQNALIGLSKMHIQLPLDVQEDLQHFIRQMGELQFTTSELAETEELVESQARQQRTPVAGEGQGSPFDRAPPPARISVAPAAGGQGAGGGEGEEEEEPSSPLPDDPFNMDSRLQSSTVRELEGFKLRSADAGEGGGVSVGEESLLEASEDNQDVLGRGAAPDADAALRGLRELATAGRAGGMLEGIAEAEAEAEGEAATEGEAEEEQELGTLVEEVVAMMEEGEEGEGAANGNGKLTELTAEKGEAAPPTKPLSPDELMQQLARSSLEHLAHGEE